MTSVPPIALVNPSVGYSDRRKSKPIGLAYIGAYLRAHGFDADGFDFGDSEVAPVELSRRHRLDRYEMVGFSVYNESLRATLEHAAWIKRANPDAVVILGGPHATAVHEKLLVSSPLVDAVVRREGEAPMLDLARLRGDPGWYAIPGTTVRLPSGDVQVNPDAAFISDLDALPFPDFPFVSESGYPPLTFFDSEAGRLRPALAINSSRSCPYNCSFCGVLTIGRKYRMRSGASVAAELEHFRAADQVPYSHVYFSDANFFVYPRRALEIVQELKACDPTLTFSFGTRVNQLLKHEDVIPKMQELGLRFVELGIESASQPVLDRLAKGVTPDVNLRAVRFLNRLGVGISLDFIMIDPETTLADLRANQQFLRDGGFYDYVPHEHLYTSLVLYAGTPIRTYYEQRTGRTFGIDELPPIDGLIEVPSVRGVHHGLTWFRRTYQDAVDIVLAEAEAVLQRSARQHEPRPVPPEELRLQLDVVALRHAPTLFFDALLDDADEDFPRSGRTRFAPLLPRGTDGAGLDALLRRAAQRVDALSASRVENRLDELRGADRTPQSVH